MATFAFRRQTTHPKHCAYTARRMNGFARSSGQRRMTRPVTPWLWATPGISGHIPDKSVHLVVTSPPYWTLKKYAGSKGQLGDLESYDDFLVELVKVWAECARVLAPGGRVCCVVGDVCIPRKRFGRHLVMPLHADIRVHARKLGLDVLTPILWHKVANGVTEAAGNGAGFYGKSYQPRVDYQERYRVHPILSEGRRVSTGATVAKGLVYADKGRDAGLAALHLDRCSWRFPSQRPSCSLPACSCRAPH